MTVLITLTTAGADSGPFDLYTDLDGYLAAFESGISKVALEAGYASYLVPDYTNTIRVKSNGALCTNFIDIPVNTPPIPSCPDKRVVIQICNENSFPDDNFDIYLNNTYIGAVDLNYSAQIGSIFIADLDPSITVTSSDFACPLPGMVVYHFDPAILSTSNILEMRNTQNNGFSNLGTIGIRNYDLTGTDLTTPCFITDLNYSGVSGENFTFNFNYTSCCDLTPTTTTTTTAEPTLFEGTISSISNVLDACGETLDTPCWIYTSTAPTPTIGDTIYLDAIGSIPFTGTGEFYHLIFTGYTINYSTPVDNLGAISGVSGICV